MYCAQIFLMCDIEVASDTKLDLYNLGQIVPNRLNMLEENACPNPVHYYGSWKYGYGYGTLS